MDESGEITKQINTSPKRELGFKKVSIRSILPNDDPAALWSVSVRSMQSADPRFTTKRNSSHVDFENPYKFYKEEHRGDLLVAEIGGKIIVFGGFIENSNNGTICDFRRLRVDPEYQNRGVGQRLVTERERAAIKLGYKIARVGTTNRNQAVLHLLLKNGYRIIKETPQPDKGFGSDFVEYQLEKILVPNK